MAPSLRGGTRQGKLCAVLPGPLRVRVPLSFREFFSDVCRDTSEWFWTEASMFGPSSVLVLDHPCHWRLEHQLFCCRPRDTAERCNQGLVPSAYPSLSFLPCSFFPSVPSSALESPEFVTGSQWLPAHAEYRLF